MQMRHVGWSDLVEDLLGFGLRSLRSLRQVLVKPRPYFEAAQTPDWSGFTPSFRLYIALFAVSSALRFLYLGDDGLMTELYTQQFETVLAELKTTDERFAGVQASDIARDTLDGLFRYVAPIQFAAYTLFGLVWGAYGEKLTTPVRVRYIYALLIPSFLVMTVATLALIVAPAEWMGVLSFGSMGLAAIVIGITAYAGAFPQELPRAERAIRATVLGLILLALNFLATLIAMLVGMFGAFGNALG